MWSHTSIICVTEAKTGGFSGQSSLAKQSSQLVNSGFSEELCLERADGGLTKWLIG